MSDDTRQYRLACDVNDTYRRARMNTIYYGEKAAWYRSLNRWLEGLLALGASGTVGAAISSMHSLTIALAAISAILGVLKAIMDLSGAIARSNKLWAGYNALFVDTGQIVRDMLLHDGLRPELEAQVVILIERYASLTREDETNANEGMLVKAQTKMETQIPHDRLWWPTTSSGEAAAQAVSAA